jgi:hypothetical protein
MANGYEAHYRSRAFITFALTFIHGAPTSRPSRTPAKKQWYMDAGY